MVDDVYEWYNALSTLIMATGASFCLVAPANIMAPSATCGVRKFDGIFS